MVQPNRRVSEGSENRSPRIGIPVQVHQPERHHSDESDKVLAPFKAADDPRKFLEFARYDSRWHVRRSGKTMEG